MQTLAQPRPARFSVSYKLILIEMTSFFCQIYSIIDKFYQREQLMASNQGDLLMVSKWFRSTKYHSKYWFLIICSAVVHINNFPPQLLEPISRWHDLVHSIFEQCAHDIDTPVQISNFDRQKECRNVQKFNSNLN